MFIHDVPEGDEEVVCANQWCNRHALRDAWGGVCRTCSQHIVTGVYMGMPVMSAQQQQHTPEPYDCGDHLGDHMVKSCMNDDCENPIPVNYRFCSKCFQDNKHALHWACSICHAAVKYRKRCPCSLVDKN